MIDAAYIKAATGREQSAFRVLGLPLAPYTVGHAFLLMECDSPYVLFQRPPTLSDFLLAVTVCATRHDVSRKHLKAWWLPLFFRFLGWLYRKRNLIDQMRILDVYFAFYCSSPVYKIQNSEGKSTASPLPYVLLAALLSEFSLGLAEAMDMPVNFAMSLCAANGESRGTIQLPDQNFHDLWDFARAEDLKKHGRN